MAHGPYSREARKNTVWLLPRAGHKLVDRNLFCAYRRSARVKEALTPLAQQWFKDTGFVVTVDNSVGGELLGIHFQDEVECTLFRMAFGLK